VKCRDILATVTFSIPQLRVACKVGLLGTDTQGACLTYHLLIFVIALGCFASAAPAGAHPGGLNAEGCHNNRTTGGYHCHRASSGAAPSRRPSTLFGNSYYPNCAAARAAGAAPIRAGDPGYSRKLDRDGDGVACE
jgi:hypothetical protein